MKKHEINPKVFLTGASGFIGAAVAHKLVAEGFPVALLLRPNSDTQRITEILDKVEIIKGDLGAIGSAGAAISEYAPDVVIHLAWSGVKGAERNEPRQADNFTSSIALYDLVRHVGIRRFVGLGSQAEYGPSPARIDESSPTLPTTTYGAAKLATCQTLMKLAKADGISFAWLRLFSSYGPGDDPDWLISYMIRSLLSEEKPALTKGEQSWDYLYIEDAAEAIIAVMNSEATGVFNLGSGRARPLHEIITGIRDLIDPKLPLGFGEVPYRSDQVMHLEADITALSRATGWRPKTSLEEGLKHTVDWHRKRKKIQ
ncbi:MAG: NAD(P)-dependent oxidoreductase [Pseudomonadota bacterium]|nr:NAD(P)-dependent oxidoreductase [Pseudomonadota bacterium]